MLQISNRQKILIFLSLSLFSINNVFAQESEMLEKEILTDNNQWVLYVGIAIAIIVGGLIFYQMKKPRAVKGDKLPVGPRKTGMGTADHAHFMDLEDGKAITGGFAYGVLMLFFFNEKDGNCKEYDVIQLSNLTVEQWDATNNQWTPHGNSHSWNVDGPTSNTDATHTGVKPVAGKPGLKQYTDMPGSPPDPWTDPNMRGKKFRYVHKFETYIVCLRPTYSVLGFFKWEYEMELTVGTSKKTTSAKVTDDKTKNKPTWNNGTAGGNLRAGITAWNPAKVGDYVP